MSLKMGPWMKTEGCLWTARKLLWFISEMATCRVSTVHRTGRRACCWRDPVLPSARTSPRSWLEPRRCSRS